VIGFWAVIKVSHLVSAWSSESQLVLAQLKVSDKSNEITAVPFLLDTFKGKDSIITIDAMGTQKKIAGFTTAPCT
jgi:hypothetical protein